MPTWRTKYGWRTRVEVRGEKVYGPTFPYKAQAKAWCAAEKKRRAGRTLPSGTSGLLSLVELHLDEVQINRTSKTYYEKRGSLERLLAHVGNAEPEAVTPPDILQLLNQRAREASNHAANKDLKNIRSFYRWLARHYGILHDPTAVIERKSHQKKTRRLLPIGDIFKVIMAAAMPERALVAACWHTAARKGEILRLRWDEDVNLEHRWIRLGTRKTRDGSMRYERLWINDDLLSLLKELWRTRDKGSPHLFPACYQPDEHGNNWRGEQRAHRVLVGYRRRRKDGTYKESGGLCRRAGVDLFGFHDIRHTAAKYLNDLQKVGIKKVQQVLRQRRQTTTELYLEGNYSDTTGALDLLTWANVQQIVSKNVSEEENKGPAEQPTP